MTPHLSLPPWRLRPSQDWLRDSAFRSGIAPALGFSAAAEAFILWWAFGSAAARRLLADPSTLWTPWFRWDALARDAIAKGGYGSCQTVSHHGREFSCSAFQPLHPYLGAAVRAALGLSTEASLMLVSAASLALALAGLYRLVRRDHDQLTARWALVFLVTFPTAFFLVAPYAESLLLACAVWAFVAIRSGRMWLAGVLLGAAILTKVGMVVLLPALVVEVCLCQRELRARVRSVIALIVPAGAAIGALLLFYARVDGNPLSFAVAERGYDRALAPPWVALGKAWSTLLPIDLNNAPGVLDLVATAVLVVSAIYACRHLRPSYAVLLVTLTLLFTSTTQLTSTARYTIEAFPVFVALAVAARRHPLARLLMAVSGGGVELIFLWLFSQGYWAG